MATRESGSAVQSVAASTITRKEIESKIQVVEKKTESEPGLKDINGIAPQAERVLRVFPGTIIKNR